MRTAARVGAWSVGLLGMLAVVAVLSAAIGPVRLDPLIVAKACLNAIGLPTGLDITVVTAAFGPFGVPVPALSPSYTYPFDLAVPANAETIVRELRLPRISLAAVVGFSLAAAGAVMQGFFRNPMADPSIIGVSAGAAAGAVAVITLPLTFPFGLHIAAFSGALITAFAVYLIATRDGHTPVATLLLAGIAVQTFLGAVVSYLLLHAGESLEQAVYWLMGHLQNSSWGEVQLTLPLAILAFAVLLGYSRDLNVLLLGEADAQTLGIEVERSKRILLAVSSIITAAAVAVAGVIGFVGLIVPHVMRLIVGPDHRILLPTSALAGATFLVLADTVARAGPAQLPVGIVTAAVGAPFFLYLLRRREVHAL